MTEYIVLARKYRPQKLDDVVGQSAISQTLKNALKLNRMPHALLLTGTRGVGKTTTARILAKALNCEAKEDIEPCGVCSNCTEIAKSANLDVFEIDGASNTSVDDIRQLKDSVQYPPVKSKHKIYIIDEVHMLSNSAFNALLKTLEEPPPGVYFIFATTEAHKIPETILSRCQRFDFREISTEQIVLHLKDILAREGIEISQSGLAMVAQGGQGSLRDALSLLDQVIAFAGEKIQEEDVVLSLGLTDRVLLEETLQAFVEHNTPQALELLSQVFEKGFDPKMYLLELWEQVRWMFIYAHCGALSWIDTDTYQSKHLIALCKQTDISELERWFDLIKGTLGQLPRAEFPRYLLEALFVRVTRRVEHVPYATLFEKLESLEKKVRSLNTNDAQPSQNNKPESQAPQAQVERRVTPITKAVKSLPQLFQKLGEVKPQWRPIFASVIDSSWTGDKIQLRFSKPFIYEKANEPAFKDMVKAHAQQMGGQPIELVISLADQTMDQKAPDTKSANPIKQAPIIQKAISLFDVQGSDIKISNDPSAT